MKITVRDFKELIRETLTPALTDVSEDEMQRFLTKNASTFRVRLHDTRAAISAARKFWSLFEAEFGDRSMSAEAQSLLAQRLPQLIDALDSMESQMGNSAP